MLNKVSCTRLSVKIALISYWNDFSLILWGSVLLKGKLRKYAKNSNFENFESAIYMTSGVCLYVLGTMCSLWLSKSMFPPKGRKPIQDQSSVAFWIFAGIITRVGVLNGSHGFDWAAKNSWARFGALGRFSYVINSISLVDHVCKHWPNQKNVMFIILANA